MREIECNYEITIISGNKKTGRSQFMSHVTLNLDSRGYIATILSNWGIN